MNKLTRALTLGGFGVLTALAVGTGPAQAVTPTAATPESKTTAGQAQWRDDSQIVGFYRSLRACEMAGRYGERAGAWDDHDCSPVRGGMRHGTWALEVGDDDDWGPRGFGRPFQVIRGFPGQFRPSYFGQYRPGQFGHGRPGQFGHGRPGHFGPGHFGPGRPGHFGNRPGNDGPHRPNQQGPRPNQQGPRPVR